MSNSDTSVQNTNRLPKPVREVLSEDEEIIASLDQETSYYATSSRVLAFKRPAASAASGLVGLLSRKRFIGEIAYSRITDIEMNKVQLKVLVGMGLFINLVLLIIGIVAIVNPGGLLPGLTLILIASGLGVFTWRARRTEYQFVGPEQDQREKIWRIIRPPIGGRKVDNFINAVKNQRSR